MSLRHLTPAAGIWQDHPNEAQGDSGRYRRGGGSAHRGGMYGDGDAGGPAWRVGADDHSDQHVDDTDDKLPHHDHHQRGGQYLGICGACECVDDVMSRIRCRRP